MRTLAVFLLLLGSAGLGVSPLLEQHYGRTRPTSPEPGRVIEHHVRGGTTVYLSALEHWVLFGSFAGGALLAVAGAWLYKRGGPNGVGAA